MSPRALAATLPKLTKPVLEKHGRAYATLIAEWTNIAGPALSAMSLPEKLSPGAPDANGGTLTIRVAGRRGDRAPAPGAAAHRPDQHVPRFQRRRPPENRTGPAARPGAAPKSDPTPRLPGGQGRHRVGDGRCRRRIPARRPRPIRRGGGRRERAAGGKSNPFAAGQQGAISRSDVGSAAVTAGLARSILWEFLVEFVGSDIQHVVAQMRLARSISSIAVAALVCIGAASAATPSLADSGGSPAVAQAAGTPPAANAAHAPRRENGDMVIGAANAPVTIIEYASLTCPHCARFHTETLPKLKADYVDTGKVKFIFRDYPLDRIAWRAPWSRSAPAPTAISPSSTSCSASRRAGPRAPSRTRWRRCGAWPASAA